MTAEKPSSKSIGVIAANMVRIESTSILADADRGTVFGWLRDHNLEKNGPFFEAMERGASKPLAVTARDDHGAVLGGLIGETLLNWLRVHVMAVSPGSRNSGIGTRLLAHAEEEARARGCTHAYVDTMSHQSPEFYRKLGYSEVGHISNWDSHGHAKHFFTKRL
jgi:GNAT superfamily N-acetyltransferase